MQQRAAISIVRSIQAMTREEKQKVRSNFNHGSGFFGIPLDHEAPILVCDCISFIRNRGFYETGVFRIPGNLDVVNLLKNKYNDRFATKELKTESAYSVLNKHKPAPSVNDVASLLKLFFTELPEPLVPKYITKAMLEIAALNLPPEDERQFLGKLVKRIPSPNRECLGLLISFLRELCAFRKFNHMSSNNLATCFVLSVFGRGETQTQIILVTTGSQIIKKLIEGQVRIFMPSVKHVKANTRYKDEVKGETKKPKARPTDVMVQNLSGPPVSVKKPKNPNLYHGLEEPMDGRKKLPQLPVRPPNGNTSRPLPQPGVEVRAVRPLPQPGVREPRPLPQPQVNIKPRALPTPPQHEYGKQAPNLFGGI